MISTTYYSSRDDTGLMLGPLLISAERESESESRRAKRELEQPYAINVRDNWCVRATLCYESVFWLLIGCWDNT
jgi:hypothetical protein